MILLTTWGKNTNQIVLEGTSFYYIYKMPIAFRLPGDPRIFYKKDPHRAKEPKNFLAELSLVGRTVSLVDEEFNYKIKKAYKDALFYGVKRIAKERLKGEYNVADEQNHVGLLEDQVAGHGKKRSYVDR